MLLFLAVVISIVVAIGFTIAFIKRNAFQYARGVEWGEIFFGIFLGVVAFFISTGVTVLLIITLVIAPLPNESYISYLNIVSLVNNSQTTGEFFLGCGTIEGKEYYFYFVRQDDGGFYRDKTEVEDIILYETDEVSPRLEWTCIVPTETKNTQKWIGKNLSTMCHDERSYKLIVPKGTIIQKFELR